MDRYDSVEQLRDHNVEGRDFEIRMSVRSGRIAIVAPHGGGIEPGTSEIAEAVAGDTFSFYAFEGHRATNNRELHITSARFREPQCDALIAASPLVIAIHGENSPGQTVFIGGLAKEAIAAIRMALEAAGFVVQQHENRQLQGESPDNVCNRGQGRKGVQLELSSGLRTSCFESLTKRGRRTRTRQFDRFVNALRAGLAEI